MARRRRGRGRRPRRIGRRGCWAPASWTEVSGSYSCGWRGKYRYIYTLLKLLLSTCYKNLLWSVKKPAPECSHSNAIRQFILHLSIIGATQAWTIIITHQHDSAPTLIPSTFAFITKWHLSSLYKRICRYFLQIYPHSSLTILITIIHLFDRSGHGYDGDPNSSKQFSCGWWRWWPYWFSRKTKAWFPLPKLSTYTTSNIQHHTRHYTASNGETMVRACLVLCAGDRNNARLPCICWTATTHH